MKLHHLRTAFLVICLLLVCSQGRSQVYPPWTGPPINDEVSLNNTINLDGNFDFSIACYDIANPNCFNNDTININNTDPAVPEPTTLSLLAMSLLFAGRRWR